MIKEEDRSSRPGPPAIPDTAEELRRLELVRDMACRIQKRYDHQTAIALTGGGALRLAYGIERPTYDLDMDSNGSLPGVVEELQKFCKNSTKWKQVRVDRKQGGRGFIRANMYDGEKILWGTKVDLDDVGGDKARRVNPQATKLVETTGGKFRVQPLEAIVQRKIDKTFTDRCEGRDLYDLTWLMANHPEAFPYRVRYECALKIADGLSGDYEMWETAVREDQALQRARPRDVIEAAWQTAINEPWRVRAEIPDSYAVVRGLSVAKGTADVVITSASGERTAKIITERPLGDACRELMKFGLDEKGRVLEIERTLEQALANARAQNISG